MKKIPFYKKAINKILSNFRRINNTIFNKVFFTWTSKKLAISSINLRFTIDRIYPSYVIASKTS